jgi:Tol biopolymer transport system component
MINLHDSDFVDLSNQPARPTWGAEWSPDGRRIVFNRAIPGRPGMRLFVMNADGSRLRQITRIWGEYPAWSPDGQLIAFMSNRCACNGPEGAEYDVYTVRPDGLRLHRLTSWPGEEAVGGWSPDGRELAYGRNPDQHPGIWLIPREGGTARHLEPRALGVQLRGSTWEPDGSFLANAIRAGVDPQATSELFVYRVSPDGQSATLLLRDADGARLRPSGAGRMSTRLTLRHRWLLRGSTLRLELLGHLSVAGNGAARSLTLGRLGALLPTRHLRTLQTRPDGTFRVRIRAGKRADWTSPARRRKLLRTWRVATAFYPGSPREWSMTAFDSLRPR